MSTYLPPRPRTIPGKRLFAVVASKFNPDYMEGLVNHATAELRVLAPNAAVTLHQVPGAFEIPIVVRELASQKTAAAIIALGVIIKGKTGHAEHLARSVTDALQRIAIEEGVPVINAVLSVVDEKQARERCLGEKINRGTEAARAAVEIADVIAGLRSK